MTPPKFYVDDSDVIRFVRAVIDFVLNCVKLWRETMSYAVKTDVGKRLRLPFEKDQIGELINLMIVDPSMSKDPWITLEESDLASLRLAAQNVQLLYERVASKIHHILYKTGEFDDEC